MIKTIFLSCMLFGTIVSAAAQPDSVNIKKILAKAYYFEDHNQPDSEIVYMKKVEVLSKKAGFARGISTSLSMLGVLYTNKGDYPKAIAYYYECMRFDEKAGDAAGVMRNAGNMGVIYDSQGNYPKALWCFRRALKMAKEMKIEKSISIQYTNVAIVLSHMGKLEEALFYQQKALEADRKMGDESYIAGDLINIGVSCHKLKRYDQSLQYGFEALEMARRIENDMLIANALNLVAESYGDKGDFKRSEQYFIACLEVGKKVGNPDLVRGYEEGISDLYEKNNRPAEALQHYKRFIVLRDSIHNREAAEASIRAEVNYTYDKKQAALQFRHDRKVYRLNTRNRLNLQLGIFLGIVLLLALVLLVFAKRAFNTKKRLADFLAAEDHRKEILLQEVHHRINNNLQIISSLLSLQANAAEDEKLNAYLTQSQNRIQSLAALHELMYDTNSPLEVNIGDYFDKILDFHRDVLRSTQEHVTIETAIAPTSLPTKQAVPLALIMNELVTNAIKYAFAGRETGTIRITFGPEAADGAAWIMTVADNGKGLPPDSEKRRDSLGLKLVELMTKQLRGTFTAENNNGASFRVRFRS